MSWLSDFFGTSNTNQNFNYNPSQVNTGSVSMTGGGYDGLMQNAQNMLQQSKSFMDPNSAWANTQRANLQSGLQDQLASTNANMNRQLAARGIGGGNLSSLLSMANSNRMGDQLMKGQQGINNQAMGFGMQSAQLANQGFGQAGNLYSNAQNRLLNAATTNAGMLNEGTQFGMMSNYNQALTNQQRRADLMSNVLGAGASIIGGM